MPKRFFTPSTPLSSTGNPPPLSAIPSTFQDELPLPSIIVFDLDYTLWPFWVDTHVSGPLKPASKDPYTNTRMLDRWGETFSFYPEVPSILHAARERNITLSLASRTHTPDLARTMLRGLAVIPGVEQSTNPTSAADEDAVKSKTKSNSKPLRAIDYFTHSQIFPGSKVTHFQKIQEATRRAGHEVAFADMLFFDDEGRNRDVETQLGVTFCLVRDGVTRDEVDRGVREWRKRRGITRNKTGTDGSAGVGREEGAPAELEG